MVGISRPGWRCHGMVIKVIAIWHFTITVRNPHLEQAFSKCGMKGSWLPHDADLLQVQTGHNLRCLFLLLLMYCVKFYILKHCIEILTCFWTRKPLRTTQRSPLFSPTTFHPCVSYTYIRRRSASNFLSTYITSLPVIHKFINTTSSDVSLTPQSLFSPMQPHFPHTIDHLTNLPFIMSYWDPFLASSSLPAWSHEIHGLDWFNDMGSVFRKFYIPNYVCPCSMSLLIVTKNSFFHIFYGIYSISV